MNCWEETDIELAGKFFATLIRLRRRVFMVCQDSQSFLATRDSLADRSGGVSFIKPQDALELWDTRYVHLIFCAPGNSDTIREPFSHCYLSALFHRFPPIHAVVRAGRVL